MQFAIAKALLHLPAKDNTYYHQLLAILRFENHLTLKLNLIASGLAKAQVSH